MTFTAAYYDLDADGDSKSPHDNLELVEDSLSELLADIDEEYELAKLAEEFAS